MADLSLNITLSSSSSAELTPPQKDPLSGSILGLKAGQEYNRMTWNLQVNFMEFPNIKKSLASKASLVSGVQGCEIFF